MHLRLVNLVSHMTHPLPSHIRSVWKQIISPNVVFTRSRFARTESRFARRMKLFRLSLFLLDLKINRIKSSSRFFSDRSNDKSNTNKQAKKVCEYSSFFILHSLFFIHHSLFFIPGETTSYSGRNDSQSGRNDSRRTGHRVKQL